MYCSFWEGALAREVKLFGQSGDETRHLLLPRHERVLGQGLVLERHHAVDECQDPGHLPAGAVGFQRANQRLDEPGAV